ncbi:hypothetical protein [Paenibacillus sp. FSL R5-0486]|uniref:hypothetical protein n=1 Tax=Paenibacillus sp. FSL R5-0486 TaxID=2921645 RepID=UPI0030D932B6
MNIRIVPINQINAEAYNPRVDLQPGDVEYEKLRRSIEEFNYVGFIFCSVGERPAGWKYKDADRSGSGTSYRIGYQASAGRSIMNK